MHTPLTPEESHFAFRQARDMNRPGRSNARSYRGGRAHQAKYRRKEMLIIAQTVREYTEAEIREAITPKVKQELGAQTPRERAEEFVERLNLEEPNPQVGRFLAMAREMMRHPDWHPGQERIDELNEILMGIARRSASPHWALAVARFLGEMTSRNVTYDRLQFKALVEVYEAFRDAARDAAALQGKRGNRADGENLSGKAEPMG
jgi:hypothetical protein